MDADDTPASPVMRASDRDRDQAASVVNEGLALGMLSPEEHAGRLDAIYAAKTRADLVPLTADLPEAGAAAAAQPAAGGPAGKAGGPAEKMISIFGGTSRKGRWRPRQKLRVVTVFGGTELDFRDAVLPGRQVTISATTVFGGMEITVPPDMHVVQDTVAIFGGAEHADEDLAPAEPDAPVLRVTGFCMFGGVGIKRTARAAGTRPIES